MSFLPVAIIAYALGAGALLIDKILIKKSIPNPITYTFYICLLQLLVIFLIPFGFAWNVSPALYFAAFSGVVWVGSMYTFFSSLKTNQASVVGIVVGIFNPIFALILGTLFFGQTLTFTQDIAFFVLLVGTIIFTLNLWLNQLQFNRKFLIMSVSGFLFGLSYVLLRQAFLEGSFLNGLVISRLAAGFFAISLLVLPNIRKTIFASIKPGGEIMPKTAALLLGLGQVIGASSGLLITYGVSLESPALVNALFGIQYPIILIAAIALVKNHPHLLDETLTKNVVVQKLLGAIILSLGLYLLAQ